MGSQTKLSGEKVSAKELLEFVRKSVSEYALTKILKSPQLGDIDGETRFYLLWRWTYNSAPACLLYWEQNNRKAIAEVLEATGNLNNDAFWQVAQAISEVLPEGDKEKQMLQGFLYGKESYGKAGAKVDKYQKTLFEEE